MLKKSTVLCWLVSVGLLLLFLFLCLLFAVLWIDVAPIGPMGAEIGLSHLNAWARDEIGIGDGWYALTEWLGYLALASACAFGILGIWQWICRKSLWKVDRDLFCVAGAYALVAVAYLFFELVIINYRPVLVDGAREASFPSSHTMLVIVLSGVAAHQLYTRIQGSAWRWIAVFLSGSVALVTVVGRLLSGVHWLTDILGGVLLGGAILFAYFGSVKAFNIKNHVEKDWRNL